MTCPQWVRPVPWCKRTSRQAAQDFSCLSRLRPAQLCQSCATICYNQLVRDGKSDTVTRIFYIFLCSTRTILTRATVLINLVHQQFSSSRMIAAGEKATDGSQSHCRVTALLPLELVCVYIGSRRCLFGLRGAAPWESQSVSASCSKRKCGAMTERKAAELRDLSLNQGNVDHLGLDCLYLHQLRLYRRCVRLLARVVGLEVCVLAEFG